MDELKPCPLCLGEAYLLKPPKNYSYRVACKKCRCNTGGYKTEKEATEAWNGRAEGQKWIPVSERMPEKHKLVLCLWIRMGDGFRYGLAKLQRENVWWVLNEGMPEVTHWMPLPEPPRNEKGS